MTRGDFDFYLNEEREERQDFQSTSALVRYLQFMYSDLLVFAILLQSVLIVKKLYFPFHIYIPVKESCT